MIPISKFCIECRVPRKVNSRPEFFTDFLISDITSKHQINFFNYWHKLREDRSMPSRADLNPADIVKILPFIMLFEKKDSDFKVRLTGTRCASVYGELTGKTLKEMQCGHEINGKLKWCINHKQPFYQIEPLDSIQKKHLVSSALAMPLSNDGQDVNMIIVIHDFF